MAINNNEPGLGRLWALPSLQTSIEPVPGFGPGIERHLARRAAATGGHLAVARYLGLNKIVIRNIHNQAATKADFARLGLSPLGKDFVSQIGGPRTPGQFGAMVIDIVGYYSSDEGEALYTGSAFVDNDSHRYLTGEQRDAFGLIALTTPGNRAIREPDTAALELLQPHIYEVPSREPQTGMGAVAAF